MAALVFAWGTLSARLERFDVTAPIIFVAAGLVLTHGRWRCWESRLPPRRSRFWRRSRLSWCCSLMRPRVGLRDLRGDLGLCLRLLGVGLSLTIGLGTLLALALFGA